MGLERKLGLLGPTFASSSLGQLRHVSVAKNEQYPVTAIKSPFFFFKYILEVGERALTIH